MKKTICAVAVALALALPLAGCSSSTSSTTDDSTDDTATEEEASDDAEDAEDDSFDAVAFYEGQWRAVVETSADSPYGTTAGTESMLDVYIEEDGTCSVVPLEDHADLLTDEGTWEGDETTLTLHLTDGDITITVVDDKTLTADPTDFGIDGFDELTLVLY